MVSIKDIAKECKVSVAAVSRALNNSKGISKETREAILTVCDAMGYRPNSAARSLILKKTHMIGLIIPDITNKYYAYVIKGVNSYLEKAGYGLVLCNSDRNKANEAMYCDFLARQRVDGVIMIPIRRAKEDYAVFARYAIPLVLVDNFVNDLAVSFVANDNYAGARKIIQHMIAQGYRRIGAILGDTGSSASNNRLRGYLDVVRENGIAADNDILLHSKATFEDGTKFAKPSSSAKSMPSSPSTTRWRGVS